MMWTVPGPPRRRSRRVLGRLLPAFKPAIPDIRVKSGISTWNPCDIRGIRDIRAILEKIYLYIYFFSGCRGYPGYHGYPTDITAITRISRISRIPRLACRKGPLQDTDCFPRTTSEAPRHPIFHAKKHAFSPFYVATGCSSPKPPRPTKHWQEWDETHIGALW